MTYPEALQYLDSLVNYEKKDTYDYGASFGPGRMGLIAGRLGNPQDSVKSIHIAGTKGKGSVCAFVHSILKSAGYRTGLYTSPHLVTFKERIRINDSMIGDEDIARLVGHLKNGLEDFRNDPPSFFEAYTALAFLYFKEKKADFAVYETGLGGRLDATNVVKPLVTAITPISYEHTDKLGNTLKEIAAEKGGIIKEEVTCVSAPQADEAMEVIAAICKSKGSPLIRVGEDIKFKYKDMKDEVQSFQVSGRYGRYDLSTTLLGEHQVVNAATAVGIIESLEGSNIVISTEAVEEGVASCRWPGRLEVIARSPLVVVDGAQNKASAHALAEAMRKVFRYKRLILVLGVSKDKDIKGILEELLPVSDSVVLTKSRIVSRACEPSKIAELAGSKREDIILTSNVGESIARARELAGKEDLILITGSLFAVGEAMEIIAGT